MKSLSGIMSHQSQEEYLESCRARYPSRNRKGKSTMIDEVSDVFGWNRKHTIKALNGNGVPPFFDPTLMRVSLGLSRRWDS